MLIDVDNYCRLAFRGSLALILSLLVVGCGLAATPSPSTFSGPALLYSYVAPGNSHQRPRVYVAALSGTKVDQPIAMTVLDPISGRAIDTFPLKRETNGLCKQMAGAASAVGAASLDNSWVPFHRWREAAVGKAVPYHIRLYIRSVGGTIWETEVDARYNQCVARKRPG